MPFAGAAGSKPLAALPQFSSVPGRLARRKSGEETLGQVRRGRCLRRAGGTGLLLPQAETAAPISAPRDAQEVPKVLLAQRRLHTGVSMLGWALAGAVLCPSVSRAQPTLCGLGQVSMRKGSVVPRAGSLSGGRALLPSVGCPRGGRCCGQGLSGMQPHISLFPASQVCFKSCDETELQNPLYEHPN